MNEEIEQLAACLSICLWSRTNKSQRALNGVHLQVGWVKADTKAIQAIHEQVITHNPRVSVSHSDATTWNLHIKAVTEEDSGGYMCQLNTDPMKSQASEWVEERN